MELALELLAWISIAFLFGEFIRRSSQSGPSSQPPKPRASASDLVRQRTPIAAHPLPPVRITSPCSSNVLTHRIVLRKIHLRDVSWN